MWQPIPRTGTLEIVVSDNLNPKYYGKSGEAQGK